MKRIVRTMMGSAGVALALLASASAVAYEEPAFTVVERGDGFEVRRYPPALVAETEVAGEFDEARNAAFRRLFAYISGANRGEEKIEMTIPVTSSPSNARAAGEKVEMTVPVTTAPAGSGTVMQFFLPAKYTLDTAPRPTDERVRVRRLDERLTAVRTYSGRTTDANYRENEAALLKDLERAGYAVTGQPLFAVYNGPFTPWFMRRNEVIVPVARAR